MSKLKTKRVSRSFWGNGIAFFSLTILGLFMALPIIYSIINSFKPINELFLYPPRFFIINPTIDNYLSMIKLQMNMLVPIERYFFNSIFVSAVTTAGYVMIAALAAYPLAKKNFIGKALILQIIVSAILFRTEVISIPQYVIISNFGLVDTYAAIILPAMSTSFGVFLMRQFMSTIPDDMLESADLDGCTEYKKFWSIIMPMVRPAWLTLIIFTFQAIWNTTGVQYIYSENMKMLPAALSQISTSGISRAGIASAIAVILMLPPIGIFIFSQKSVIETMAHSGMKS